MNWWGKIVGGAFGFSLMGPLGALLGSALGHMFDQGIESLDKDAWARGNTERVQAAFFTATFSVMGYLAKIDGRVSRDEIDMAGHIMDQMDLQPEQRKAAIRLFNQGKKSGFPINDVLDQFKTECARRSTLIQMFLEIQIMTVLADGIYHPEEQNALQQIAEHVGYNVYELRAVMERVTAAYAWEHEEQQYGYNHQQQDSSRTRGRTSQTELDYAYSILGLTRGASEAEVKKAYRRLMRQHHPDKLVSKGLPEEMMELAKKKAQEITLAYNAIRKSRQ